MAVQSEVLIPLYTAVPDRGVTMDIPTDLQGLREIRIEPGRLPDFGRTVSSCTRVFPRSLSTHVIPCGQGGIDQ